MTGQFRKPRDLAGERLRLLLKRALLVFEVGNLLAQVVGVRPRPVKLFTDRHGV